VWTKLLPQRAHEHRRTLEVTPRPPSAGVAWRWQGISPPGVASPTVDGDRGHEVIGALNVFGSEPGNTLDDVDVPVVQALADVAAIGLLQERAIRRGEILTEQLQCALNSRIVIEQPRARSPRSTGSALTKRSQ
jgi:hypothetical protein